MSGSQRLAAVLGALAALTAGLWWAGAEAPVSAPRDVGARVTQSEAVEVSASVGYAASPPRAMEPASENPVAPIAERTLATRPLPAGGVRVHVVDDQDRGIADIELAMTMAVPGRADDTRVAHAHTDAEGTADLVADAETLRRLRMMGMSVTFAVGVDAPLPDAPRVKLGDAPTADAPVILRLPPFGGAVARVLDPAGAPIDDGGDVFLFWRPIGSDERWDRIGTPRAPSRGGEAVLATVPLGQELLLRASGTGHWQSGEVVVRGPQTAGEVVRVDLRMGPAWAFVVGQFVDAQGAPFVRPQVAMGIGTVAADASLDTAPAGVDTMLRWTKLDAAGRFRVRAGLEPPAGRRRVLVAEHTDEGREAAWRAIVPLPDTLASGVEYDVGAVTFVAPTRERVLCTGRVVDAAGKGLAGIDVAAGYHDSALGRWVGLHQQRVRTDADGDFEVRSALPAPESFTLSASAHDRVPVRVEISEGSHRVLTLARGGRLQARIQAPPGVPAHLLVGSIVDAQRRAREPSQFGGGFGAGNLAPGRYDVVVRIAASGIEIARVPGIVVSEGQKVDDERLTPIDVTGRCRGLHLRLLDIAGHPIPNASVQVTAASGRTSRAITDADGWLICVVPVPAPALALLLDDGRRAEIRPDVERQTLTLRE